VLAVSLVLAWSWAAATPAIARWAARAHPARGGWARAIAMHLPATLLAAAGDALVRRGLLLATGADALVPFRVTYFYYLDIALVHYGVVVGVAHAVAQLRRLRAETVRALALEAQLARAQLAFLELQLQPHFLFNSLGAISELAHEQPAAAARMVRHLRALFAAALRQAGRDEIPLREELAVLESYLEIQRTRFSDWLTVETAVDPAALDAAVPALVLQPLVENAIRHGLAVRRGPGTVRISARVEGTSLHLEVRDDGVGFAAPGGRARGGGGGGIGLPNVAERLRQLYGGAQWLTVRSPADERGAGTEVAMAIPFRVLAPTPAAAPAARSA
jgi:LytS/YehU family sensor histidine kinase